VSDAGSVVLILDAAEELFAQQGFDATSIRAVTRHAGMNPAAVHYHFGSKEVLLRALLERRIAPLNQERILLLDHVLRDGDPDLERILDAYLRPVLRHASASAGALNSLLFGLPEDVRSELVDDLFGPIHRRFHGALRQALPELSTGEVEERFRFAIAVMLHVGSGQIDIVPSDAKALPRRSREDRLRAIVGYLAYGMRAPGSANLTESTRRTNPIRPERGRPQ
jgi:AcrR family transcriptional regulator